MDIDFSNVNFMQAQSKPVANIKNSSDQIMWESKKIIVTNLLKEATSANYSSESLTFYQDNPYGGDGGNQGLPGIETITQKDKVEGFYVSTDSIQLIKNHVYYVRWTTINANVLWYGNVSYDVYWPIAEPRMTGAQCLGTNIYERHSAICTDRTYWNSGKYQIRFDVNNRNLEFHVNFCCPMLIDLTEVYGSFYPPISELDKKPYFLGQIELANWI